jgi:hypothetical protein
VGTRESLLSPEVERRVEMLWPEPEHRRQVREALASYGMESYEREQDRVRLAILKLSGGDLAESLRMVSAAKRDYRDVLMWAEYPEEGRALWAVRPNLTQAEEERLEELRRRDRQQYEEWLKAEK